MLTSRIQNRETAHTNNWYNEAHANRITAAVVAWVTAIVLSASSTNIQKAYDTTDPSVVRAVVDGVKQTTTEMIAKFWIR